MAQQASHRAVCAACGEAWPCASDIENLNRSTVLFAIATGKESLVLRAYEGSPRVEAVGGRYSLPLDDDDVRAAFEAVGWVFVEGGMRLNRAPERSEPVDD